MTQQQKNFPHFDTGSEWQWKRQTLSQSLLVGCWLLLVFHCWGCEKKGYLLLLGIFPCSELYGIHSGMLRRLFFRHTRRCWFCCIPRFRKTWRFRQFPFWICRHEKETSVQWADNEASKQQKDETISIARHYTDITHNEQCYLHVKLLLS